MRALFRVDASRTIGTGHVTRCVALANALARCGVESRFLCRSHPGEHTSWIRRSGHQSTVLPVQQERSASNRPALYAGWLGADVAEDAADTILVAGDWRADILVVDHYAVDITWERLSSGAARVLMTIDDLADRQHECDVLLDQNWFGARTAARYHGLVPARTKTLLGPTYALLDPRYAEARAAGTDPEPLIERLLVFMGGADPDNATALVLRSIDRSALRDRVVDVVLGVNHPDPDGVRALAALLPACHVHMALQSLLPLMRVASLMVSAGGSVTWERMCLGVPGIVIAIAENQVETNIALHEAALAWYAGFLGTVTEDAIVTLLNAAAADPSACASMGRRSTALVDGRGAALVAEQLVNAARGAR